MAESAAEPLLGRRQRRRGQLQTADDVARALGRIVRATLAGKLDTKRGKVAVDALRALLVALEQADGDRKLAAVEAHLRRVEAAQQGAARAS